MEIFDLYDCDRKPLNLTMIRGEKQPEKTYRLVVHCCIFNSENQMLIQRRQDFKKGFSGMWDLSCGGSAVSGENSQTAIHRELFEELGIDIDFSQNRPVLTVHFDEGFDDIFTVKQNIKITDLKLQYAEVAEAKWASENEIFDLINAGKFIPYHESLIDLLFYLKDKRGTFKY